MPERFHATAIALAGKAALIRGASGSGKSDLALRCLAIAPTPLIPHQARLISDDYVELERRGRVLIAVAPPAIRGRVEVRGLGIVTVEPSAEAEVALLVDLVSGAEVSRYPDPMPHETVQGMALPILRLSPFEASAPVKLLLALAERIAGSPPGQD